MLAVYALLSTAVLLLTVKILQFLIKYGKIYKLLYRMPSPPGRLFIGHVHLLMANPDSLFQQMRNFAAEYRPIYRIYTPYLNVIAFLDPNDVELVLSSTKHLTKGKAYTFLHNWLGTGLLTSTGSKWHNRRKILTPAFHFSILQQFLNVFNEETAKLVQKLEEDCQSGKIINVVPPITNFTLQSIAETAMGFNNLDETVQKTYKKAISEINNIFFRRLCKPWFRIGSVYNMSQLAKEERATVEVLHDFSTNIIEERAKATSISSSLASYSKKKRLAMLDLLLAAKKEGADIDSEGIREEVDTFMFEGHDTTSMAISYILLVLANLPDIQEKVLNEILAVLGSTTVPTYNELQEMKYTEQCIKEVLRLFPSVPVISRHSSEDFTTKTGYTIPKGSILQIQIFNLHRDPDIYPDPLKFDPDRFLPENINQRHPFAYIPFSAGPRNCIGQKFALLELKAVLCGILRKFRLEKVDDMHHVEFQADLVLRPKNEIRVKMSPRAW